MNNEKLNEKLVFVSISDLSEQKFYIPGYQRGYRWQPGQVIALLEDIWEFRKNTVKHGKQVGSIKYCLQPLVVSKRDDEWEVVDGQQRLTTLFLIQSYLRIDKKYTIRYETPYAKNAYELTVGNFTPITHIDSYHLDEAYKTIQIWFSTYLNNDFYKDDFRRALAHPEEYIPQFIWYNVTEEVNNNENLAIDIFDRLNVGKISLTNAELIKALFMTSLHENNPNEKYRKQIEIGHQWDNIELTLSQPLFWNFICQDTEKYVTKIEYIFDIIMNKEPNEEDYFTFNEYYKKIYSEKAEVDKLWEQVEEIFQLFTSWYADKDYFHLIGYLITADCLKIKDIINYRYDENRNLISKVQFKKTLLKKAKDSIKQYDLRKENFYNAYPKADIRKVLLLFNILSIISNKDNNLAFMRFPFNLFREKDENNKNRWDVEHIHSQTDKNIDGKDRKVWIETMISYFTGVEINDYVIDSIDRDKNIYPDETIYKFCLKLKEFYNGVPDNKREEFNSLVSELRSYFKENDENTYIHSLGNLTLLDKYTNRSYQNSFFPVKRMIIMQKAKKGVFIPLCTQNIFLKAYSKALENLTSWTEKDCKNYLETIIKTVE